MNQTTETSKSGAVGMRGTVIRQIYRVWLFRTFLPVLIAEIIILSVLLYVLGQIVFVEHVFQNGIRVFFERPSGIGSFIASAFGSATNGEKLLLLAIIIALAFFIRLITQGILRFILVRVNYFSKVHVQ